MTTPGTLLGTVAYLSPEALWGLELDERADLWALGVTLFEMLAGCRPFAGDSHGALVTAILNQSTPEPSAHGIDIPPKLAELIGRLLHSHAGETGRGINLRAAVHRADASTRRRARPDPCRTRAAEPAATGVRAKACREPSLLALS
jgi:serine/threonine-protein kinase